MGSKVSKQPATEEGQGAAKGDNMVMNGVVSASSHSKEPLPATPGSGQAWNSMPPQPAPSTPPSSPLKGAGDEKRVDGEEPPATSPLVESPPDVVVDTVAESATIVLQEEYTHASDGSKVDVTDFELLKVLGKGAYGKVMLCRRKQDTESALYAMKTMRKATLLQRDQIAHAQTERYILQNIHCPFLTRLIYAFQTKDKLYMCLEYLPGGELFFWLKKEKRFSEERVRLYAAELTLALEAMHEADIVYRDIKPENILLDAEGHIRVTDFGLAKGNVTTPGLEGGTRTFCGTPEYLAPEMLENKGHGKAVDWWALGTLVYEMLVGLPPFFDNNTQRMYHKILHDTLRFPKNEHRKVSEVAKNFVRGLLQRKIADRTGSTHGAQDLKESPFFDQLDFSRVYTKSYKTVFQPPMMRSSSDVRNFDLEFTRESAVDSMVVSEMSATLQEKTRFEGFTYEGPDRATTLAS